MTFRGLTYKALMVGLTAIALGAPAAPALEPFTHAERQGLASRGVGAPASSVAPRTIDLRSPDARDVFVSPAATADQPSSSDGVDWGVYAIIAAALAACVAVVTVTRRRLQRVTLGV